MNNQMNTRELATVLAALRYYQQGLNMNGGHPPVDVFDIADVGIGPLTDEDIDDLCERLNR